MRSCWEKVPADRVCVVDICTNLQKLKKEKEKDHQEVEEHRANYFVGVLFLFDEPSRPMTIVSKMSMKSFDYVMLLTTLLL